MNTWHHSELGSFKYEFTGWVGQCSLPAFQVFKYRWYGRHVGLSEIKIEFEAESADEKPSKRAVAVALRAVKNQELLAGRVKRAVWNDLHGRGRQSGMWWHGDLDTIHQMISRAFGDRERRPLSEPDDLDHLIGGPSVWIWESIYRYEKPSATILFEAAFEVEHGLGVLTDGTRALGVGYQTSVEPFCGERGRKTSK